MLKLQPKHDLMFVNDALHIGQTNAVSLNSVSECNR